MIINNNQLIILKALVKKAGLDLPSDPIEIIKLKDGEMGSFRIGIEERVFGKQAAEISFKDSDNTDVSAALNLDEDGELFEVDIFKADFSPLKSWPKEKELN